MIDRVREGELHKRIKELEAELVFTEAMFDQLDRKMNQEIYRLEDVVKFHEKLKDNHRETVIALKEERDKRSALTSITMASLMVNVILTVSILMWMV